MPNYLAKAKDKILRPKKLTMKVVFVKEILSGNHDNPSIIPQMITINQIVNFIYYEEI